MRYHLAAALFTLTTTFAAHADTIFSTINPSDPNCNCGWITSAGQSTGKAFTLTADATLTGATVILGDAASFTGSLSIYTGAGNTPTTLLETLGSFTDTAAGAYSASSTLPVELLAGEQYWLVLTSNSGDILWLSDGTAMTAIAGRDTSTSPWFNYSTDNDQFSIQGTPVPPATVTPEPASLALFGTGLLGFVGIARRRRLPAWR